VNNHPMQEGSANGEVEVGRLGRDGNEVKLKVPTTGKDFNLKAGQVYLPVSNTIKEISTQTKNIENEKAANVGSIGGDETQLQDPSKNSK